MHAAHRGFDAILMTFAVVASIIIAAMAVAIPIDALARTIFSASLFGMNDLVENGLMAAVFLAAPWVLSRGAHVSVDLLAPVLDKSSARVLQIVVCLIGLGISLVMTWYGIESMTRSIRSGTMVRKVLVFPHYWTLLPLIICFALSAGEFARQLVSGPHSKQHPNI